MVKLRARKTSKWALPFWYLYVYFDGAIIYSGVRAPFNARLPRIAFFLRNIPNMTGFYSNCFNLTMNVFKRVYLLDLYSLKCKIGMVIFKWGLQSLKNSDKNSSKLRLRRNLPKFIIFLSNVQKLCIVSSCSLLNMQEEGGVGISFLKYWK